MMVAVWLLLAIGGILAGAGTVVYLHNKNRGRITAALVVTSLLSFLVAGIVGLTEYQQHEARTTDAIRTYVNSQGYSVINVADGYDYLDHKVEITTNGWGAYASRKDNPNCKGVVNVVVRGGRVTIVGTADFSC